MVIEKRASAVGMLVSLLCLRQAKLILNLLFISSSVFKKVYLHFICDIKRSESYVRSSAKTGSVRDIQQGPRSWVPTRGQHCYIVLNHLRVRWKSVIPWALKERFIFHIVKHYIDGTLRTWFSVYSINFNC